MNTTHRDGDQHHEYNTEIGEKHHVMNTTHRDGDQHHEYNIQRWRSTS